MSGQALTVLATIVGIAVGLSALGGIILRRLAPVVSLAQQLHGEPGDPLRGIADRPGILERQTTTEREAAATRSELAEARAEIVELRAMVSEVVAALRNNGGSSVKDVIDKTYAMVSASAA